MLLPLFFFFFFFNDTATTEIYTLSLHDALPISFFEVFPSGTVWSNYRENDGGYDLVLIAGNTDNIDLDSRSEEHTSELQSRSDLVCRLLLEKKKNKNKHTNEDNEKPTIACTELC